MGRFVLGDFEKLKIKADFAFLGISTYPHFVLGHLWGIPISPDPKD